MLFRSTRTPGHGIDGWAKPRGDAKKWALGGVINNHATRTPGHGIDGWAKPRGDAQNWAAGAVINNHGARAVTNGAHGARVMAMALDETDKAALAEAEALFARGDFRSARSRFQGLSLASADAGERAQVDARRAALRPDWLALWLGAGSLAVVVVAFVLARIFGG